MLQDHSTHFINSLSEIDLNEKIQDGHTAQYSRESYVSKYAEPEEITIPVTRYNNVTLARIWLREFNQLIAKLNRNKFRSIKTRNECIQAINSILKGDGDQNLVDKATSAAYRY